MFASQKTRMVYKPSKKKIIYIYINITYLNIKKSNENLSPLASKYIEPALLPSKSTQKN